MLGAANEATETAAATNPSFQIVTTSKVSVQLLAVDDAIMQLNLASEQFLVFRNASTHQVNVVYRREDGNYGLIETSGEDAGQGKSGHSAAARA